MDETSSEWGLRLPHSASADADLGFSPLPEQTAGPLVSRQPQPKG